MKARICIVPKCQRKAEPDWARCHGHNQMLVESIFGGSRAIRRAS